MRRLQAALCGIAVLLTACAGGETSGDDPTEPSAVDGTGTETEDGETEPEQEPEVSAEPGPGVEGDTVKIVFTRQESSCAETPEGTAPSQEFLDKGARLIDGYVGFMNDEVLSESDWQLDYEIVDDGGAFCPELQTAAARRITQEIQPFAVLGDASTQQGPILADAVTAEGILHVGKSFATYEQLDARAPYAWVVPELPLRGLETLMAFVERRVLDTPVEDRSGDGGEVDRVYGIIAQDGEAGDAYAELVETRLSEMGVDVAGTYRFPIDPAVAAQQATTRVTQMSDDGVNTLVWGVDIDAAQASWAVTAAMAEQDYRPDILVGASTLAFVDSYHEQSVWSNAYGISQTPLVAIRHGVEMVDGVIETMEELQGVPENENGYTRVWQEQLGNADDPQEAATPQGYVSWQQLSHVVAALMHIDGTVNAESYAASLDTSAFVDSENRCTVGRLMGRDEPHASNPSWSSDNNGGFTQFTTVYWMNEPREEVGVQGHWESFDNFTYFPTHDDLPAEPTHDTGELGMDIEKLEPIGIAPWTPCSDFPNYPEG